MELEHVFVYGTLKRGQCRENCWPVAPQRICNAWTLGKLIDLGPYPGLLVGSDRVWGELWSFDPSEIDLVHETLDRIEVFDQPGVPNEYERVQVRVHPVHGSELAASTYRWVVTNQVTPFPQLSAELLIDGQLYVVWPGLTS